MSHAQAAALRPAFPPAPSPLDEPSVARVTDFLSGGQKNWCVDRTFADKASHVLPVLTGTARANRWFMQLTVRGLARRGVRQFLDIGAGGLTAPAAHHVADALADEEGRARGTRIVYVDHDATAIAHAELILDQEGDPDRHVAIEADLRDPQNLWTRAVDSDCLDPDEPVAVLLCGVLHYSQPDTTGADIGPSSVAQLRDLLAPGSYLAVSHVTDDGVHPRVAGGLQQAAELYARSCSAGLVPRSRPDIEALLGDFEVLEPGWGLVDQWWPRERSHQPPMPFMFSSADRCPLWAGVGRKPQAVHTS